MSVVDSFIKKQKANSPYIRLADGESITIKELVKVSIDTITGFDGKMKEVLTLLCKVDTEEGVKEKMFQNGSTKFPTELQSKGIEEGDSFMLLRLGTGAKTVYSVANVVKKAQKVSASAPAPTPAV